MGIPKKEFFAPLDEDFWAGLSPTPKCFDLVNLAEDHFGRDNVCILTSPILTPGCAEGKLRWLRMHLPRYARKCLIGPCKELCASPQALLVDDSEDNCRKFEAWRGKTVLVPAPWNRAHALTGQVAFTVYQAMRRHVQKSRSPLRRLASSLMGLFGRAA